jgi:hypothetical protein
MVCGKTDVRGTCDLPSARQKAVPAAHSPQEASKIDGEGSTWRAEVPKGLRTDTAGGTPFERQRGLKSIYEARDREPAVTSGGVYPH